MARTLADLKKKGDVDLTSQTISKEEKAVIAAQAKVFSITHVSTVKKGNYDPKWRLTIIIDNAERYLTFPFSDLRDSIMESLKEATVEGPIDGCILVKTGSYEQGDSYAIEPA